MYSKNFVILCKVGKYIFEIVDLKENTKLKLWRARLPNPYWFESCLPKDFVSST